MKPNAPPVYWLGLHKTGTTFLQACLEASREVLVQHRIDYQSLSEFRKAHTRPLLNLPGVPEAPSASSLDRCQLIFDENILGLVQHVASSEGLYLEGPWRADEMADHLGLEAPQLVLGLRGFAGFLPSLYCEALKATPFQPFRRFLRTPLERLSWQPLVAGLLDTFPDSPITIYTAETLRNNETRLLSHLLDIPAEALSRADHSERPGFSQQAVDEMMKLYEAGDLDRAMVRQLVRARPRGPDAPGFDPWSVEERTQLDSLYTKDLEALLSWPRVTLLDPSKL